MEKGTLAYLYGSWETVEIVRSEGSAEKKLGVTVGEAIRLELADGE